MKKENKPFTMDLPVDLDQFEVQQRSDQLAQKIKTLGEKQEEKKLVTKELADEIKGLQNEVRDIATVVRNRKEDRPVDCMRSYNEHSGMVTVTRIDTGDLVDTRPMNDEEQQEDMFWPP